MNTKTLGIALGLTALLGTGAAQAAVVLTEEGTGFVGKGDVQLVMDWNNSMLQANAGVVSFEYVETSMWEYKCEWWTGQGKTHHVDKKLREMRTRLSHAIGYDPRKNKHGQITGFTLTGFEGIPEEDAISCEGEGAGKQIVEGSLRRIEDETVDPKLRVSPDGGVTWVDLPITQ